jgi:hypothetical protein
MRGLFTVELPSEAAAAAAEIELAMAAADGVARSGRLAARSLDPVSIGVWVQMAAGVVDLGGKLGAALARVFGIVKERNIKGARLKLDGMEIELGEMTVDEFEQVVARLKKTAG